MVSLNGEVLLLISWLWSVALVSGSNLDASTLKLVHVLFRHGDRSPMKSFPTDLVEESYWPQGYAQLSVEGMRQEYSLGQFLKKIYVDTGFMSAAYNRSQVYVRSTDVDRTLMSAQSVLAGLFPPTSDEQLWNKNITWQPIPVHTVPLDEDHLLSTMNCPVFDEQVAAFQETSSWLKKVNSENKDLYEYVGKHINKEPTWQNVREILDPVYIEVLYNLTLPAWIDNKTLNGLLALHRHGYYYAILPQKFGRFMGGTMVGEMIDHMNNTVTGNNTQQKMFIYSAHDTTVAMLLQTLNTFNGLIPNYTACLMVELHYTSDNTYVVQILYRNDTTKPPYLLKLPDCAELCPLDQFLTIMKPSVPEDIVKLCGLAAGESKNTYPRGLEIVVFVLSSLLFLVVLVTAVMCCLKFKRKENGHDYSLVPMDLSSRENDT